MGVMVEWKMKWAGLLGLGRIPGLNLLCAPHLLLDFLRLVSHRVDNSLDTFKAKTTLWISDVQRFINRAKLASTK